MKEPKTTLICYDDFKWFSESVSSRFADSTRYHVISFTIVEEFMLYLEANKEKSCKAAILGVHDTEEQMKMIGGLVNEIKSTYPGIGVILISSNEQKDNVKKMIPKNIDAYIPKNSNIKLRLHNAVKKLISEYAINAFRKQRKLSFSILAGYIITLVILFLIARFRFSIYF